MPWHTDIRAERRRAHPAGGRDLRVVARPGHSTTDTLFVDDRERPGVRRRSPAGLHLLEHGDLSRRPSPTGRARARGWSTSTACGGPRRCRSTRLLSGHGDPITDHAALVEARFGEHQRRCERIVEGARAAALPRAYEIARRLWSARTVAEQPLLVVWEVLGHLDLLLDAGAVTEQRHRRRLALRRRIASRSPRRPPRRRRPTVPAFASRSSQPRTRRRWWPCTSRADTLQRRR